MIESLTGERAVMTYVSGPVHHGLKRISKESRVSLRYLVRALLAWGAEKDVATLIRLGLVLPQWPVGDTTVPPAE